MTEKDLKSINLKSNSKLVQSGIHYSRTQEGNLSEGNYFC